VDEGRRKNLDGNIAPEACVARAVHFAHGTMTQQADNLIRPEPVACV
jgi:hypothetical protein